MIKDKKKLIQKLIKFWLEKPQIGKNIMKICPIVSTLEIPQLYAVMSSVWNVYIIINVIY